MKKSTKTFILIILLALLFPFLTALYLHKKVKNNDYDQKFVVQQQNIIPDIRTLEMKQVIYNELDVFLDGSYSDTLYYFSNQGVLSEIMDEQDSMPRIFVKDHLLTIENTFNKNPKYSHRVCYFYGGKSLEKVIVDGGYLRFFNSTDDRKKNIEIEILAGGHCEIGDVENYSYYHFKPTPDSNQIKQYQNLNVTIEKGTLSIKDHVSIDTLNVCISNKDAKIEIGKGVKIKFLKGELQSLSQIEGSFENMEGFRGILKPNMP